MKNLFLFIITVCVIGISCKHQKPKKPKKSSIATETVKKITDPKLELLWETDTVFKTPESCFFDEEHNVIYVSNINNAPRTKDNNGFISKLDLKGNVLEMEWVDDLSAPKGMGFYHEVLFVTDIDAVVEINAHTGMTIRRSTLEGALMLNDISVDEETGIVYVSDMDTGKVYTYFEGEFTLWKDGFNYPNGVLVDGDNLLVNSVEENTVTAFNKKTKEKVKLVSANVGRADGVEKLNSGNYIVSDWRGEINYILDGKPISLFNTLEDKKAQTADIGLIKKENIILVPTFFGNSVKAFKVIE